MYETIEWSASNASQPQVFRAFSGGLSGDYVGEITFSKVRIRQRDEMRPCLQYLPEPERLALFLKNGLLRLDDVVLTAFFQTVPPSDDFKEARIDACLVVWKRFSHLLHDQRCRPRLQEYDYVNSKALKRLNFSTFDVPNL
jgi:hypothetical protein